MAKVATIQTSWTGGELSPRLDGRPDLKKFQQGAREITNAIVLPHGGVRKRSGSKFVIEQKAATDVALVPFQYSTEQSYMLVFGNNYVWFLKDGGIITQTATNITSITQANPAVVTSASHGLDNGDYVLIQSVAGMTEINNRRFVVANKTANTFELSGVNSTSYEAYTSGGTVAEIVELTTTYTADEVLELQFAQSADTLYVVHKDHPIRKIQRSSHTSWTLSEPDITTGPFRTINPTRAYKLTPSSPSPAATTFGTYDVGTTFTLTASGGHTPFTAEMVGALFRLSEEGLSSPYISAPVGSTAFGTIVGMIYTNDGKIYGLGAVSNPAATWQYFTRVPSHDSGIVRVYDGAGNNFDSDFLHPTYCVVRITGYTSSTVVTAEVVRYHMPASIVTSGTSYFEEGAWSDRRGYPRAITFYEQRLFMAGVESDPSVVWGSRTGAYEDFTDGADDADALIYRVPARSADVIRWLNSSRVLTAGTSFGEYAFASSSQNQALTPSNVKASLQTSYGTSECLPVQINQAVLYPQRNGAASNPARKLREFQYRYDQDAFGSTDMTVFSEHIFGEGVERIAYQTEPDSVIWCKRVDGSLAGCTFERLQEVVAWHRHTLGGADAVVKTIGVIPGDDGDEVWLSVERTIDGGTVRYIEVLAPAFKDDDNKEDCKHIDAHLTYSGASSTTISGLWHLRGETVKVLNNGAVETGTVTSGGRLTLSRATTKAHIGYGYTMVVESEDFEAGAQAGTAQSRAKRISEIYVRVLNSLGGMAGPDSTNQKLLLYRKPGQPMGTSPPLYSGLVQLDFPGGWDRFARVRIEHSDPLPFHVTSLVVELTTTG